MSCKSPLSRSLIEYGRHAASVVLADVAQRVQRHRALMDAAPHPGVRSDLAAREREGYIAGLDAALQIIRNAREDLS